MFASSRTIRRPSHPRVPPWTPHRPDITHRTTVRPGLTRPARRGSGYDPGPWLGRDARRPTRPGRAAPASWTTSTALGDELHRPPGGGRAGHRLDGHLVHGLLREGQHRPGLALRRDPPGHRPATSGTGSPRASPSGSQALNLFIDDLYGDAKVLADGIVPGEIVQGLAQLPARVRRHPAAARHVGPHLRQRPGPRRRRRAATCSRTTSGCRPACRTCSRTARSPSGCSPTPSATSTSSPIDGYPTRLQAMLAVAHAPARRGAGDRRAHARHLQLGLLRARLPRPADGRAAGRGQRPRRRRRRRVLRAHRRRPRAGRRDLPAGRRPLPRPRGVPARLRARRARPDAGVAQPATSPSPTRPAPASPTTRSSTPTCPTLIRYYLDEEPLLASVPTYVCLDDDDRRYVLDQPRRAGREAGQRERRLRHLHRHRTPPPRRPRPIRRRGRGRPPQLDRPAHRRAVDRAHAVRRPAGAAPHRPAARSSSRASGPTSPTAASPAWRCARARWWSTARRAAAARTRGSSTRTSTIASPATVDLTQRSRSHDRRRRSASSEARVTDRPPRRGRAGRCVPLPRRHAAVPGGRAHLLGRPLPRAGRGAPPASSRTHTELFVDLPRSVGLGWAPLLAVTGSRDAFDDGYDRVDRGRRRRASCSPTSTNHGLGRHLDRAGPREPARHPRPAPAAHVGGRQRDPAVGARQRRRPAAPAAPG